MTNKYRGVPVEIDGRPLFLRFDFNALVALEEALGSRDLDFRSLGFKAQRALVWAGLQGERNPPTLSEVGEWLTPLLKDQKAYTGVLEKASQAYALAFPEAAPEKEEGEPKNAAATPGVGT